MLYTDALELTAGDELWYDEPYKPIESVKYLSGPFEDTVARVWVVVGTQNGALGFFKTRFLEKKPRLPVVGETWIKKADSKRRYVDGVTDKWVIIKGSPGTHDSRAFAMLLDNFQKDFRPDM